MSNKGRYYEYTVPTVAYIKLYNENKYNLLLMRRSQEISPRRGNFKS
nr:MAG TPA: hypothetical protein [Caudoviricetes sp.]